VEATDSSFTLPTNVTEGRKAISYQQPGIPFAITIAVLFPIERDT